MSGEINKIESIKNMAAFNDFRWVSSVRDGGNNIAEFKKINTLYGRTTPVKQRSRGFSELSKPVLSLTNIVHLSFNWLLMVAALLRKIH